MIIAKSKGPVYILCCICNLLYQCNKFMIISIANSLHTFFLPHYMYYHFCLLWKTIKHLLWKLKIIRMMENWRIWVQINYSKQLCLKVLKIIHCISVCCKRCKVCYCRFLILPESWIQRINSFVSNAETANAEFLS